MTYIGRHGVETLRRWKYCGVDKSYLAKYVLQPFWSRCVNFFPLWMAPNIITLLGFSFIVTSALLSYVYSPQLASPPPKWIHFIHGLLLFLYQTFDAVDGKQARRTNSSSPLGELFDHGCDALACAFATMAVGNSVMSGRHTIWFWVVAAVPFYCATWESFFTNTLLLPEFNGPTEGLMLIYMFHFFTSFVGAEWWAQDLRQTFGVLKEAPFVPDIPVYYLVLCASIVGVVFTVRFNVYNVHKEVQARNGNMLLALAMLFPCITLVGGVFIWGMLSPFDVLATQPHLLLVGTGFAFGYMVGRMILAHQCDEPKGLKTDMCKALLFLPLAIVNALSAQLLGGIPLIDERLVLLGYCIFTVTLYMHFASSVIQEITAALGIQCFRITKRVA